MFPGSGSAAEWIAREAYSSLSPQMLYPGMQRWWHAGSLLAGREMGRRRVMAGPPCGPKSKMREAYESIDADAREMSRRLLWFGVSREECDLLQTEAFRRIHLGDQAILPAEDWADRRRLPSGLRSQIRRAERHRLDCLEISLTPESWRVACDRHPWLLSSLLDCREPWLRRQGRIALGFMTTCLDPRHPSWWSYALRHLVVACRGRQVVGYVIASATPKGERFLVENFVRHPLAPNGLMEFLLHRASVWGISLHCGEMNLGLAPLHQASLWKSIQERSEGSAGAMAEWKTQPRWYRALTHGLRRYGEPLYRFRGLARFKDRLHPSAWEPLYLIAPSDGFLLWDALALAGAFLSK